MANLNAAEYFQTLKERNKLLNKKGIVKSLTTIYQSTPEFPHVPYAIGQIQLDDGEIVYAQIIDAHENDQVIGCLRKLKKDGDSGLIWYGVKFRKLP